MTQDCGAIKRIIDSWEREGSISNDELARLSDHLEGCPNCRERYRTLLLFIRRCDGGNTQDLMDLLSVEDDAESGHVSDRVMREISGFQAPVRAGVPRAVRYFAAAAILTLGILIPALFLMPGLQGHRSEPVIMAGAGRNSGGELAVRETAGTHIDVHFHLVAPEAEHVVLVGDFTGWEASQLHLEDPDGDGIWETWVTLRRNSVYEYNFVIDGEVWISDPNASIQVDDGFGGESSLLRL